VTAATSLDPKRLADHLVDAGWTVQGHRTGVHIRLSLHGRTLIVPLDTTAPEYAELIGGVVAELRMMSQMGSAAREVLDAMTGHEVES
jgi:hypothetical protein